MSENRKGTEGKKIKSKGAGKEAGKRKQHPNLRLIKNGDLPVDTEAPKKKPAAVTRESTVKNAEADSKGRAGKAPEGAKRPAAGRKSDGARKAEGAGKKDGARKAEGAGKSDGGGKAEGAGKSGRGKKTGDTVEGGGRKQDGAGKSIGGKNTGSAGKSGSGKGTKDSAKSIKGSGGKAKKSEKTAQIWDYGKISREAREDRTGLGDWYEQHRSLVITGFILFLLAALLAAGYYYIVTAYRVTTVYVDGNVHYTNEEVMDMVMTGRYGKNSLYLAVKYKDKGVEGIPFVEKMDINILSPDTIRINVYEKALAGYVEYLGRYMYFDKDGIVTESSSVRTAGIPQVTGLDFNYVVLNESLPVENDEIFIKILNIAQLLTKYELAADKIFFDSTYDVTLYFEGVRVTLGDSEDLDEKIMKLRYILPDLEGKKGVLRMENYTEDTRNIPFNQD